MILLSNMTNYIYQFFFFKKKKPKMSIFTYMIFLKFFLIFSKFSLSFMSRILCVKMFVNIYLIYT